MVSWISDATEQRRHAGYPLEAWSHTLGLSGGRPHSLASLLDSRLPEPPLLCHVCGGSSSWGIGGLGHNSQSGVARQSWASMALGAPSLVMSGGQPPRFTNSGCRSVRMFGACAQGHRIPRTSQRPTSLGRGREEVRGRFVAPSLSDLWQPAHPASDLDQAPAL